MIKILLFTYLFFGANDCSAVGFMLSPNLFTTSSVDTITNKTIDTTLNTLKFQGYVVNGVVGSTGNKMAVCASGSGSGKCIFQTSPNIISATLTGVSYTASSPTVSSCGTSPSVDVKSSNNSGTVTVGSVSATSCTITFSTPFTTFNHCRVASQTSLTGLNYTYTLSAITVTATGLTGDIIEYSCDGI